MSQIETHLQKKHKLITEGSNTSFWMIIGMALGITFGASYENLGIGIAVGMAIGIAIGGLLDYKAQKGGRVI